MVHVAPTRIDALRNMTRLDENASAGMDDTVPNAGRGNEWTIRDIVRSIANGIADDYRRHYGDWSATSKLGKFSKRDAELFMVARGASPFTVQQFARIIASHVRSLQHSRSWVVGE